MTWTSRRSALRADGEHEADDKHPDHQLGIDRWATGMRVVGLELLVDPPEVEHAVDLAHEVVGRHHVVEIELVEELALLGLAPPHHARPRYPVRPQRNHGSPSPQREFCNTLLPKADNACLSAEGQTELRHSTGSIARLGEPPDAEPRSPRRVAGLTLWCIQCRCHSAEGINGQCSRISTPRSQVN